MIRRLSSIEKGLLLLFLAVVFFYSLNPLQDPDAFTHLKTGQVIWESKGIPTHDIFSAAASESPWRTHGWLSQVFLYGIFSVSGYWGLAIFAALLAIASYFFAFRLALHKGAHYSVALLIPFAIGLFAASAWSPQPIAFAYLFFILLIALLERYKVSSKLWLLGVISLVMLIWANMNLSFVLGIVIVLWYAIAEFVSKSRFEDSNEALSHKARIRLACAAGFAFLLTFVNPAGVRIWTDALAIWSPAGVLQQFGWSGLYSYEPTFFVQIAFAIITLLPIVWWLGFRKESRNLRWLGAILAVFVLPFIATRDIGFWPLAVAPALALVVSHLGLRVWKAISAARWEKVLLIAGLVLLALRFTTFAQMPVQQNKIPVGATSFIKEVGLHGPLFNLPQLGGYLTWQLWPEERVFVDSRTQLYAGMPAEEYIEIISTGPQWEQLVKEKYRFNYFIIPYRPEQIREAVYPLAVKLIGEQWPLVYWDDATLIFVRSDEANAPLISEYGLRHVSPFRDHASIPESDRRAAVAELRSLLGRSSQVKEVAAYANVLLGNNSAR